MHPAIAAMNAGVQASRVNVRSVALDEPPAKSSAAGAESAEKTEG